MNDSIRTKSLLLVVAGTLFSFWTAIGVAQEERPTIAVWKKWQRDISQFDAELRKVVREAKVPEEESLKERFAEKSRRLEVITDGYGGVVDFDAAKGTVQDVANQRFADLIIEWEFELAADTKVYFDKSTKLSPKIAATKGEGQTNEHPIFAIEIENPNGGPFQAGDRVRLKASIDDFSRFKKDFSRAMGLVAIYYLEEEPNPVFLLKLDEAEITLLDGEQKEGEVKRQPYAQELPDRVSSMAGLWRINADVERLKGAPDQKPLDYPQSLRLSFAMPGAPVLGKETITLIEDMFVARMRHTIIAVGEWEVEKDSKFAADRDSKCFVTTRDGATYLWLGTPDKSLFGAEVHYVWIDTKRSLLILDGNFMMPPRMRKAANVVGYSATDRGEDRP